LETGASGIAVHRLFIEKLSEGRISTLSGKFAKKEPIILEDIIDAVNKEDILAIEIMEQIGSDLGKAISGLINMFNPELIVVGGTLAATGDYLLLPIKSAVNKYSLTLVSRETEVRLSKLGYSIGVIGACMLVRSKTLNLL
jgi:predicted NBD/HSP70 family sugar kinase